MSPTWRSTAPPVLPPVGPLGWVRVVVRGALLGGVTFGCLGLLLLLRLAERPLFGPARPVTPYITQFVCRSAFVILGLRRRVHGRPETGGGAVVANHSSWLDIFTLNAAQRIVFISKSDVRDWPGIGLLARATGTVFIERNRREARTHGNLIAGRIAQGHRLLFFPEGTSTDGRRVLPFKPSLFEAFLAADDDNLVIQPVTVIYTAPPGQDPRFYGWWGDMDFAPHLLRVLAASPQGAVDVHYHRPLRVADFTDRKAIARELCGVVSEQLQATIPAHTV